MMSPLEQQAELCLRGRLQYVIISYMPSFHLLSYTLYGSEYSQLINWIFFPLGTLLMFDEWNGNETATCLLAWQPTMTPNLHADATSGQTIPLARLLVFEPLK